MTDKTRYVEGGAVPGWTLGPVVLPNTLEQRVADLEFRMNRYEANLHNLEVKLEEALSDIAMLQRPRDVRYVRTNLRGRS